MEGFFYYLIFIKMTLENSYINDVLEAPLEEVLPEAQRVRQEVHGNVMRRVQLVNGYLRGPRCGGDCSYCGWNHNINPSTDEFPRVRLTNEMWESEIEHAHQDNVNHVELLNNTVRISDRLLDDLRQLSWACDEVPVGVNIGLANQAEQIEALQEMGYIYYVNDLETSPRIYRGLVGTHQWEEKLASMQRCGDAGIELHSGFILGLGEENADLAELVRRFDEFDVQAVVVNFLSPVNGVSLPFEEHRLTPEDCLRRLAQIRVMFPEAQLVLGGGRRSWLGEDLVRESFMVVDSLYVRQFLNHTNSYWLRESQVIATMFDDEE